MGEDKPPPKKKARTKAAASKAGTSKVGTSKTYKGARSGAAAQDEEKLKPVSMKGSFSKDLGLIMYGFGDVAQPLPATVDMVEEVLLDFATDMLHNGAQMSTLRGKLTEQDLMLLVRKDARKLHRVQELLRKNEEISNAKKAFDEAEALEK